MQDRLIIGTRGSQLALTQTNWVRDQILAANPGLNPDQVVVETIVTTGDRVTDRKLQDIGGKGLFTKEIEERLADGRIHLAVHSMKDMPTKLPEGLMLTPCPHREDPRDLLISDGGVSLDALSEGARLGTASLRRAAQVLARRPDIKIEMLRGNVGTRLEKQRTGVVDATILASAGINRLGMTLERGWSIPVEVMLPAVGQGALALEIQEGNDRVLELLSPVLDMATTDAVTAERAFLAKLDGDCRTPLAAHAQIDGDDLELKAQIYSADGKQQFEAILKGDRKDAARIGEEVAAQIAADAGQDFLTALKGHR